LLIDSIIEMFARKTPEIFAGQIKALLERPDARPVLSAIRCPTLVLCGREDSWSTLSIHKEIAARIPQSKLVVIENCGHMAPMERPEKVTAALVDWHSAVVREYVAQYGGRKQAHGNAARGFESGWHHRQEGQQRCVARWLRRRLRKRSF